MISAVCFDLDGLMFNTEHVFFASAEELLSRRGLPMTRDAMNAMLGRRPLESFQNLVELLRLQESPAALLDESRTIFYDLLDSRLEPMPGLWELLDRIEAKGLPKGVATSSPRDYLEHMLGRFQLQPRFPVTLTAEDVTHGKPHPEIYLNAAQSLGVNPENMLVLEDSHAGTKAAVAAGAFVVSIPHEHTAEHDFTGARYLAASLIDPFILNLL
jgi:HAD superfamily hydrolase (TIGR01509 family)